MRSGTKKTIELQETCVRLLTICLNQNVDFAKKIALEYDCFNEFKNSYINIFKNHVEKKTISKKKPIWNTRKSNLKKNAF